MGWKRTDDLDDKAGEDVEMETFGLAGIAYSIDLSEKNRDDLERALAPYIAKAHPYGKLPAVGTVTDEPPADEPATAGKTATKQPRVANSAHKTSSLRSVKTVPARRTARGNTATKQLRKHNYAEVRIWAKDNGFQVMSTGMIPRNVMEAYDAAH